MHLSPSPITILRGLAGAIAGGIVAYFAVRWLRGQNIYAMMLPGLLIGMGCGYAAGGKSHTLAIMAAALSLVCSLLIEWNVFYNEPLVRFLTHLYLLEPFKLLVHALGVVVAYWFGTGREGIVRKSP